MIPCMDRNAINSVHLFSEESRLGGFILMLTGLGCNQRRGDATMNIIR
jgi:hypothetical protein